MMGYQINIRSLLSVKCKTNNLVTYPYIAIFLRKTNMFDSVQLILIPKNVEIILINESN